MGDRAAGSLVPVEQVQGAQDETIADAQDSRGPPVEGGQAVDPEDRREPVGRADDGARAEARRHGRRIRRSSGPGRGRRSRPRRMARPSGRPGSRPSQHQAVPEPDARCEAAPCRRRHRGRGLSRAPEARSRPVPPARRRRVDRETAEPDRHGALRGRQDLARLRPWPEGVPRWPERSLSPPTAALRRSRARPRRRALSTALPPARANRSVRHRSRTHGDAMAHSSTTGGRTGSPRRSAGT